MRKLFLWLGFAALISGFFFTNASFVLAQDGPTVESPVEFDQTKLQYQTGTVLLPGDFVRLELGEDFRYLDPEQTEKLLVEGWGNPSGDETLGMILPIDADPLDSDSWGAIITYEEDGYVSDEEADQINEEELLKAFQENAAQENKERIKQGYETITLVGWATPPKYDRTNHVLYWGEELNFQDTSYNILNHHIRMLGRKGVLHLNIVADMEMADAVVTDAQQLQSRINFEPGYRYADYKPGEDKLAEYGIKALVLGGVAAKAGLFKALIALLIAGKKFILIAIAGALAWIRQKFGRRKKDSFSTDQTL